MLFHIPTVHENRLAYHRFYFFSRPKRLPKTKAIEKAVRNNVNIPYMSKQNEQNGKQRGSADDDEEEVAK